MDTGKGTTPTVSAYNYLMKQYCMRKDMRTTAAMWKGMCVQGHCKARNMKEAWFLRREMIDKGYDEMREKWLAADKEMYSIFVDINYEEGNMETTLELCDEVIENCLLTKLNLENK
ncbi:hypothetical protein like AT1G05670 [Hibiscus trionum]|uniref:Pentatricopeptide repeat-containing protein n=1 Tax=Hibiscus trionum TaxID=183268 RepID=A0A9W7LSB6_HIBTR|nr:hypothetical protein like AT1G05670 [Hibiscus trionum]